MSPSIPSVDMTLLQTADLWQSYWLLYQKMQNDFIGKEDMQSCLIAVNVALTAISAACAAVLTGTPPEVIILTKAISAACAAATGSISVTMASTPSTLAKGLTYDALSKTGGAAREGIVGAVKGILS